MLGTVRACVLAFVLLSGVGLMGCEGWGLDLAAWSVVTLAVSSSAQSGTSAKSTSQTFTRNYC